MTELKAEEYLGLMRQATWSFVRTTGLPYEDLLSSAYMAFANCTKTYEKSKGAFSTYFWKTCRTHLIDYAQKTQRWNNQIEIRLDETLHDDGEFDLWSIDAIYTITPEDQVIFKQMLDALSLDAKEICRVVFEHPEEFSHGKPKLDRGYLKEKLRKMGWTWEKIFNSFREIRTTLTETA